MKKILSYLITILLFVIFDLLNVNAFSFDCECSGHYYHKLTYTFTFHVDSNKITKSPLFPVTINGQYFGDYKLQNWGEVEGGNYAYILSEFPKTNTCPKHVLYIIEGQPDNSNDHHFVASDDESLSEIIEYSKWKYAELDSITGQLVPATSYNGTCKMTNFNDDTITSNEPSNEPTDPNSNIPTVNSNKTLQEDNTIYFCGSDKVDNAVMRNIPSDVPRIIRFLYIFLQVLVPIGIVVVSSIDLFKAISAQKEDDIKKGQQTLIKRIVAAVIIFFVFAIVKLVLSVISDNSDGIIDCISCFLENSSEYCKIK